MRINKYVSETGFCSRRETDRLIDAGRITINGHICAEGAEVTEGDEVRIDGKLIPKKKPPVYLMLNKPVGITCTAAKEVEGNIIDFVGHPERVFPIGRLDKQSEGLILLTTDGSIVNQMMRSENGHEKEYVVQVDKPIDEAFIQGMSSGVEILGTKTNPCKVTKIDDYTFRIILTQGLNRQIRRMSKSFGYYVTRLERVRIMNLTLGDLPRGAWRELTEEELETLLALLQA